MDSQPDSVLIWIGPFHPMAPMLLNIEKIACFHGDVFWLIFESESGAALQKQHPFVFTLIIPESRWGRMAARDDPLDTEMGYLENGFKEFVGKVLVNIGKDAFQG